MLSGAFEESFAIYACVASLSIMLWDILNHVKNDYRLLFQHRLGLPTIIYFLSRVSSLGYIFVVTIFLTAPLISCMTFEKALIAFIILSLLFTPFNAYLRVCAVWHWNRFIVGFFGVSWLSVAISGLTLINSAKGIQVESHCLEVVRGQFYLAPFVTALTNHTAILVAITYGFCKNTLDRDLNFRESIWLILGKGLPTFSKALVHESQVCYIIIMAICATAVAWLYVWQEVQSTLTFRLALVSPCLVLENIMMCRVFRNTKLGLYSAEPVQSTDPELPTLGPRSPVSWNSKHTNTDARASAMTPIQITVSEVVETTKGDYPPFKASSSLLIFETEK